MHINLVFELKEISWWTCPPETHTITSSRPCCGMNFDTDDKFMERSHRQPTSADKCVMYLINNLMVLTQKYLEIIGQFLKICCLSNKTSRYQYFSWVQKHVYLDIYWHSVELVLVHDEQHTWHVYLDRNIHEKVQFIGTNTTGTDNILIYMKFDHNKHNSEQFAYDLKVLGKMIKWTSPRAFRRGDSTKNWGSVVRDGWYRCINRESRSFVFAVQIRIATNYMVIHVTTCDR